MGFVFFFSCFSFSYVQFNVITEHYFSLNRRADFIPQILFSKLQKHLCFRNRNQLQRKRVKLGYDDNELAKSEFSRKVNSVLMVCWQNLSSSNTGERRARDGKIHTGSLECEPLVRWVLAGILCRVYVQVRASVWLHVFLSFLPGCLPLFMGLKQRVWCVCIIRLW